MKSITESIFDTLLNNLVDDRERFTGDYGELWLPLGTNAYQNATALWTHETYAQARAESRHLCQENSFAVNGIENRINYIVGTGHQYLLGPRPGRTPSDQLITELSAFLEDFRSANQWHTRQIEMLRRYDRDGETIIRMFTAADGSTVLRFIEPEELQ
jgi:hypothetical protein